MKKYVLLLFCLLLIGIIISLSLIFKSQHKEAEKPGNPNQTIKVIATIFPLYDMAREIGGDKVSVQLLLPPGVEAHAYEPTPLDSIRINSSDFLIFAGSGMEPWIDDMKKGLNMSVTLIDTSRNVKRIDHDPHYWLDIDNAKEIAKTIADSYGKKFPEYKNYFSKNLDTYVMHLTELDEMFKKSLMSCKTRNVVYAGHYAFGYLAKRYGLQYVAAQGIAPDAEPTVNDLSKLIRQIHENTISTIFYEELTSPRIAKTLQEETGVDILQLNGAHNISKDQVMSGTTFIEIMRINAKNLKQGLHCS